MSSGAVVSYWGASKAIASVSSAAVVSNWGASKAIASNTTYTSTTSLMNMNQALTLIEVVITNV